MIKNILIFLFLLFIIAEIFYWAHTSQETKLTKEISAPLLISAGESETQSGSPVVTEIAPSVLPTRYEDTEVIDIKGNKQSTPDLLKFDAKEIQTSNQDDPKDFKEMLDSTNAPECIDVGCLPFYPIDAPSGGFCVNDDHCCELSCPIESVPEPSDFLMLGMGLSVLFLIKRKFND